MMQAATVSPISHLLDQVKGELADSGIRGEVDRVEISKKGAVQLQVVRGDCRCWFAWEDGEVRELEAAEDSRIPLATLLKDESFAASVSLLSYRPGRRLTLVDLSGRHPRILKGFRQGQLEHKIKKYEIAQVAFAGRGVNVPEANEYDAADDALVMMFESGERLCMSADTTVQFHAIGERLRDFQGHDALADERAFDGSDELQVIDKRMAGLQQVGAELPEHWSRLRERLSQAIVRLTPAVVGLAHRDLHDKQFIQQPDCVALLDFDLMTRADVTLDPANFLAHMVLRNMQGLRGVTRASIYTCGKKFLQGLARNEEPGFWERLRFYQATTFCRLALVYAVRPRWAGLVPDLATMGNRCIDDLNRIKGN
jgi:hypothetical protein